MKFISENLQRDVLLLTASRVVRAFAFSYLNIIFAIYLNQLGYSTMTVGLVISTAFASSAVLTAVWGFLSDRYGRKKILILLAALTIVSNTIYVLFSQLFFIFSAVMISNVGAGGTGGGGQVGGPFNPVEQAQFAGKGTATIGNETFSPTPSPGRLWGPLARLVT